MSLSEQETSKIAQQGIFVNESEEDRLRRDIYRSDMEKFLLFNKMLRTNRVIEKAIITHK